MAAACCDIQCFQSNNTFVVKELALTSLDGAILEHYIFRPPFAFHELEVKDQQTNAYLTRHKHWLGWYAGVVNYSKLPLILDRIGREYSILYTKGKQKQECLQNYVSRSCTVIDLEVHNCPALLDLSVYPAPRCFMNHPSCALSNAERMRQWIREGSGLIKDDSGHDTDTSRSPDCAYDTTPVHARNNELWGAYGS